ncbi:MAG TPA: hypothetical protein VKQ30_20630 [Ktedonobacterales bacterium]|nr:hypothetical protein [Ktedonobacterales bacterium]
MAKREWMSATVHEDGRHLRVFEIACGRCGVSARKSADNCGHALAQTVVPKYFGAQGWKVGTKEKSDRCPHCAELSKDVRAIVPVIIDPLPDWAIHDWATTMPEFEAVRDELIGKQKTPTTPEPEMKPSNHVVAFPAEKLPEPVRAEPPRQMTRENRRVIFEQLNGVYDTKGLTYLDDWTDQAVADGLGVPRAWVTAMREENFGPAGDNKGIKDLIAEAQKISDMGKDLASRISAFEAKVAEIRKQVGLR